ncbi:alginate export family protein [Thalassomonas actiniarum]|uniref:Alginate export family protein n=1 Tax=Thalassomonas actiniarum TaxID=485447 RepID=A0AAE9YPA4_9GAMM|nr:alginate export family protein [Thalassomonas actiniarum]WDD98720.1 alginate export family protein [Thalassomonas actiniarum]
MKSLVNTLSTSLIAAAVLTAPVTFAGQTAVADGVKKALGDSKVNLSFRARFENVDQDNIKDDASALTLKSRITVKTGAYNGFSVGAEVDNVTAIVDNYNSTRNGETKYPVIADPEGTDVNQLYLQFKGSKASFTAGRQRILHSGQRFVGGVGWRQNEQTYDGYRLTYKASDAFTLDYSYVYNINKIFGPRGGASDEDGEFHLTNAVYKVNKDHKLSGFAYLLEYDHNDNKSTSTYGIGYNGKFGGIFANASYARQSDYKDSNKDFDADYLNLELGTKLGQVKVLAGYELLGSDNGVGFTTPLATLHKYQGFADKFLATPGAGIEDIYFTAKTKVSGIKLSATYHDFSADEGNADWGSEIDLVAAYAVDKNYSVLLKYASYDADDHSTDTDKIWFQVAAKF